MSESEKPSTIKFYYLKSNFFRTVKCDGVVGGLSPQGELIINAFSERQPIPRMIGHELNPDLSIGQETVRRVRDGLIRQVEVSLAMNINTARAIYDWLGKTLSESDEVMKKHAALLATKDDTKH